jgi:hypothetical protein
MQINKISQQNSIAPHINNFHCAFQSFFVQEWREPKVTGNSEYFEGFHGVQIGRDGFSHWQESGVWALRVLFLLWRKEVDVNERFECNGV